jgi:hypothetical protein
MHSQRHLGTTRIIWVLIVIGWIAAIGTLAFWLRRTPDGELHDELKRLQFWALETQFFLLGCLSWLELPRFVRSLKLRGGDVAYPIAACALAFVLARWVAPETNRIYYDEQIYQGIGQNLTDLRLAQMCNDGTVEYGSLQCWRGEYNKEPYGYPYLLSVAYRVVGAHDWVAFLLNTLTVPAIVWAVFLITAALTGRPRAGGYAALVAALIPEHLRWAHTAAAEPSATLACAYAVLAALAYVREPSTMALLWTVAATSFAVQFRPECLLVLPVVVTVVTLYARTEFGRPRLWWASLIGLGLLTVHLGHLVAVRHEGWGTAGARLSVAFLRANLRSNGWFYLTDARFPVVYSVLALCALVTWRERRAILVPSVYFLLFWGIFLFFYAGSYNYGADDRFSLMTFPPIAIAAGIGACRLAEVLARAGLGSSARIGALITVALGVQFLWYLPFVRTTGEEAWGARADVAFARSVATELPGNSIVLTQNPSMFHLWGQNAAQASLLTSEAHYADTILAPRYAGGVFFHWNFWCNVADPLQQSFCATALDRFPSTLIREYRERDYRYAIYRLDFPSARPSVPR